MNRELLDALESYMFENRLSYITFHKGTDRNKFGAYIDLDPADGRPSLSFEGPADLNDRFKRETIELSE